MFGLGKKKKEDVKKIAFFVDGPNMLRKEFDVDLNIIRNELEKFGSLTVAKIFLNQFAPDKLIEAVVNQGFEPIIVTSDDVDAPMAAEAMEYVFNEYIDIIALMTRDSDFHPVISKAKERGKETIVVGSEPIAAALKSTADHILVFNKKAITKLK